MQPGTTAARLAALRTIGAPPALLQPFEQFATKEEEILSASFTGPKTQELLSAAQTEADDAFEQAVAAMTAEITGRDGQAEGQARADAKEVLSFPAMDTQTDTMRREIAMLDRTRRAVLLNTDVLLLRELEDPATIREIVDGAFLSEDEQAIRRLGAMAVVRLTALERADQKAHSRDRSYVSPVGLSRRALDEQMTRWRAEHPTPAARLAQVHARRSKELIAHESMAQKIRAHLSRDRFFGAAGRPGAVVARKLVERQSA